MVEQVRGRKAGEKFIVVAAVTPASFQGTGDKGVGDEPEALCCRGGDAGYGS